MVFALAGTDPTRAEVLLHTPVAEVCMLYLNWLREGARKSYALAISGWQTAAAMGSKAKPPEVPKILR